MTVGRSWSGVVRKMGIGTGVLVVGGVIAVFGVILLTEHRVNTRVEQRRAARPLTDNQRPPDPALVVDNPAPDPSRPAFRISAEPIMTVGLRGGDPALLEADPDYDLWQVRDAVLTPDGRLVVVNPSDEVRMYDSTGTHLLTLTGEGEGPGDINRIVQVAALEDGTIAVWDWDIQRVTTFDTEGEVVRISSGAIGAVCCFADGAFLMQSPSSIEMVQMSSGQRLPMSTWSTFSSEVQEVVAWQIVPPTSRRARGDSILLLDGRAANLRISTFMSGTSWLRAPLQPSGQVVQAGDRIVFGLGDRYEYRMYSRAGDLEAIVRTAAEPIPVTRAQADRVRRWWTGSDAPIRENQDPRRVREIRRTRARVFDQHDLVDTLPAYGRIEGEEDGTVWVQRYSLPTEDPPEWWARFGADGRLLGTLHIPDQYTVVRFSRGHVILREPVGEYGFVSLGVYRVEEAG